MNLVTTSGIVHKPSLVIILFVVASVVNACKENKSSADNPTVKEKSAEEECSIKLSRVHFTKSLNGAIKNTVTNDSVITITSDAKRDYFNDPNGDSFNTAPVLLSKVDNTKPFTFSAKVTPTFITTYDAGALYIFSTDQLWQKFAFERDEKARTRIVSVRTIDTSDDNNHQVIDQNSVFLKITSDTKTVGFYYSTDNKSWNLARLYKNQYPASIWLGISSQSPVGEGNSTSFKDCSLENIAIKDFRMGE